mmetsp:Transcript_12291/g.22016  ORF Transcript_12291/g.22016 Transcript_12291/m.22016 type:complete len:507 (-) Transcript_12291:2527-4047(-)|eukprot:CAMPEP_0175039864 /NCGR_PEP_ID=MMETSP0052_2-20121109/883_1 /TAXON_ID=51329 ORGANISM="Polytomella parva, Strain SAG 63-3" /NCGR_SAMPLE_ID=MMETSP0052_2 /ASSEMBLY_ACC=CAM_ASM_000194 /LENGTH=506 /DNA_ID=CAMNT_0016301889 /DNA_START=30 /DNA_END=1550 /DNA_ORIENTATION=+
MGVCCSKEDHVPPGYKALKVSSVVESLSDVRKDYNFDKILGKGNFGVVHLVFDKVTGSKYACKSISKRKLLTPEDVEDVRREIQIMTHLAGHKNVVQLKGTYEDKNYIHLVMEACFGGELFDRIAEAGHFSERKAAEVMRTIVSVIHHCHTMNVIHRDLKPENFLLSDKGPSGVIKATDFGLSRFFKLGDVLDEIVGSPFYVAPEVLKREYGLEADIWSCGIILYILLCGWPPFHGDSTQQIFKSILSAPLDLRSDPWGRISGEAKDCVKRMLSRDPKKRLTADQVLNHPWMRENGAALDDPFIPEILTRMRTFTKMNHLKKEALKVIARNLPAVELAGMKEMFQDMDKDGSGTITVDELRDGLRLKGADIALTEVQRIMDNIDINGNSKIDYEEFLAATMHLNKLSREENMVAAFQYFDKDNSGFITREELMAAMKDIDTGVNIDEILKEVDTNGDNQIDYEEFCKMMRANDFEVLQAATKALKHVVDESEVPEFDNQRTVSCIV